MIINEPKVPGYCCSGQAGPRPPSARVPAVVSSVPAWTGWSNRSRLHRCLGGVPLSCHPGQEPELSAATAGEARCRVRARQAVSCGPGGRGPQAPLRSRSVVTWPGVPVRAEVLLGKALLAAVQLPGFGLDPGPV